MKKFLKISGVVLSVLLLIVICYLLYIIIDYHRIEDNLPLTPEGGAESYAPTNRELTLMTYNIGFGAYSDDYTFFMDGGEHSRALSKDAVLNNTNGALGVLQKENPDFVILQEVDTDGTRSYRVDQTAVFKDSFTQYDSVFAQNYDSSYFLYPFNEPIGANKSGLMTLSRYNIFSALRRSLPVENSLNKYFDLDRAYSVSVIKTDSGKDLILYNVHLSAYTSDGTISAEQLKILSADMKEQYEKGNYVIAAGDFNKDLLGDSSEYFERPQGVYNWATPFEVYLLPENFTVYSGTNVATCRNADSPFKGDGTDFVLSVDGAIVSDNIEVISSETTDTRFAFSDHNPIKIKFILK